MVNMRPVVGPFYNEEKLYIALSEAMTNVVHHAYPPKEEHPYKVLPNQWWLSGSFDKKTGIMTVLFYDQGVGIPATLPRKGFYTELEILMEKLKLVTTHHGELIYGALEMGRTRSEQAHRGKGFKQLLDFSIHSNHGNMRIISGNGECEFHPSKDCKVAHHSTSFGGTFIQWALKINKDNKQ